MLAHAAESQHGHSVGVADFRGTRPNGDPPFVLDCTGRAGVIAQDKGVRELDEGPRTIALVGEWHTRPRVAGARRHAHDRSSRTTTDGCGRCRSRPACGTSPRWSIRNDPISRAADRRATCTAPRSPRRGSSAADCWRDATFGGGPWGCDASTVSRARVRRRWLAARRRCRIVHRSAVVGRRQEGAGLGLAGGGGGEHLSR